MAQFVHQYVSRLLEAQATAGRMLGVNVYKVGRETYVLNLTVLTLFGVVMKRISDSNPLITDAVWLDALSHALDSTSLAPWPQAMLDQVDPTEPPSVGDVRPASQQSAPR